MEPARTREAIERLSRLIQVLDIGRVNNVKDYERWSRQNTTVVADVLGHPKDSGLPPAHLLVKPFFHPNLPLVGLNYGDAQRILRGYPKGWTDALRYCRGSVFEWGNGQLIALPYPKFFNLFNHEHPEADNPPDGPFEATVKLDGHLGIVFHYADAWRLTTHGSFTSRGAKLGQAMLDKLVARGKSKAWSETSLRSLNPLVEIIHPSTRIRCDYHGHQGLVLTGMMNRATFTDYAYAEAAKLGVELGMHVTELWTGWELPELRYEVRNSKPKDREGFVIRFADGTRGKLKYKHYLDRMSDQNLSYNGLMHAFIDGTLKTKMDNLAEELWEYADDMWRKLEYGRRIKDLKRARGYLYALVPPDKSSQYYRKLCREFLDHGR